MKSIFDEALNNKGIALDKLGRYNEAIECYEQSIYLDPTDADVYCSKANTLFQLNKYRDAIKCFDKSIQLNPTFSLAIANRKLVLNTIARNK